MDSMGNGVDARARWTKHVDATTKRAYWYDGIDKVSQWDQPEGWEEEDEDGGGRRRRGARRESRRSPRSVN
tara:strand:- start:4204 stop:4416 length:213 start_codon:yes stop_codon:yes gene_type:complete